MKPALIRDIVMIGLALTLAVAMPLLLAVVLYGIYRGIRRLFS